MDIFGSSARDSIVGTADPDLIDVSQGGRDTVQADLGDDTISLGGELNANDRIDGGDGYDLVELDGNYVGGVVFDPDTMVNCEEILLARGDSYFLTFDDATATGGGYFRVRGSLLGANDSLVFDGSAETDTHFYIHDGDGDDVLIGSTNVSSIFYLQGGEDTITCGQIHDTVWVYGALSAGDVIDGGPGIDTISFAGDYSAGLTIDGGMLISVEDFTISAQYDHVLTVTDEICRTSNTFSVTVHSLFAPAGNDFVFDGAAETDGYWDFNAGITDDTLTGGALADDFDFSYDGGLDMQEGLDCARGMGGDDIIRFNHNFTRDDQADGGDGFDELILEGDLSSGVNFNATTMADIELITLVAGHSYGLTVGNNNVRTDGFTVDGADLATGETLAYDGAAETASNVIVLGGLGDDTIATGGGDDSLEGADGADSLTGGAGDDTIFGGRKQDTIEGGLGSDHLYGDLAATTFVWGDVAESTGPGHDVLGQLKPLKDHFDLDVTVSAVDARVNAGALSAASFDADLAAAIGAGQLGAGHAVVFKPNAGDLAGRFFLVVDANGSGGYQAGADYVMEFAAGSNPNAIAAGFFI